MLFLADGFDGPNSAFDYSLADYIGPLATPGASLTKTSIDCPKEISGQTNGNTTFLNLDNVAGLFPFENEFFDVIAMRKGLCFCLSTDQSCGGLIYDTPATTTFFKEVVRVLNKKNPDAAVFLTGRFKAKLSDGALTFEQERVAETALRETLGSIAAEFPELQIEMIYLGLPVHVVQGMFGVSLEKIKDADGIPLSPGHGPLKGDEVVPLLDGIRITIRTPALPVFEHPRSW